MGSSAKCTLCGKIINYKSAHVEALGEHLLNSHPNNSLTHFSIAEDKTKISAGYRKNYLSEKNMYKTTVETWRPGTSTLTCKTCGKTGPPLVRKQQNKVTESSLGALCLLGCWPLCFFPFLLGGSNVMNLYCKHCGEFLGTYDRKTGRLHSDEIPAEDICDCSGL